MPSGGSGQGEFDPGAGRLLGTNDLQATIDKFNAAVNTLASTVANMSSTAANGMTRSPAASAGAAGATFSAGAFPSMAPASFGGSTAWGTPTPTGAWSNQTSWGTPLPSWPSGGAQPNNGYGAGYQPAPTLNQTAAGGGANGGGATFGGMAAVPPLGAQPQGPPGGGGGGSLMTSAAGSLASSAAGVTQAFFTSASSQLTTQTVFNSYGAQMQAQWGGSAQTYQNQAFGNGANGATNAAAGGNAQSAAQEFGTLTQMAGGANVTGTAAFGATNALAFANQGLGAAGASQVAAAIYNPTRALQQQLLTGVSAFGANGQQTSLSSQIMGLAGEGYIGGFNSKTGTFSQSALNASFTAGRGHTYVNLQSLGYDPSQIQDIQSTISQANQAAIKGKTSVSAVMGLMGQASYGPTSQIEGADKKLASMGVDISTLQLQGNKSAQSLSQQQSQSSTYNDSVKDFTDAVQRVTQGFNWFLDKTGLGKAIGAVQGASAGAGATGVTGMIKAAMGGGAGSVSATQSMTSQGTSAGSSMSSVSGQARTAVRDAETQVGVPYQYGSETPGVGYDCSSLVQWSYGAAGVRLPRTSQAQWAALRNKSVALNQVREGDIVFSAGSDGSLSAPGHEALMISNNQIIEAAHSGTNIRVRGYNPAEWQHAARPTGSAGIRQSRGRHSGW